MTDDKKQAEWKRRSEDEKQNQLEVIRERYRLEQDPNSIENQLKIQAAEEYKKFNNSRIAENQASVRSKDAYSEYRTKDVKPSAQATKAPYITLYESAASAEPAAVIQDEGQAIAVFNAILADQSIKEKDVELLRTLSKSGSDFSKDEIKNTVFKYGLQVIKKNPEKSNEVPQFFQKKENVDALGGYFRSVDLSYPQDSTMRDKMKVTYLVKQAGMTEQQAIETLNKIR